MSGAFNLVADADGLLVAVDLGGCLADAGIIGVLQVGHFEGSDIVLFLRKAVCCFESVVVDALFQFLQLSSCVTLIYSRED